MQLIEIETIVMDIAAEELGIPRDTLTPETRVDQIFSDSLEYIAFTLKLGEVGHLSEAAISGAETLGDLANAIISPN